MIAERRYLEWSVNFDARQFDKAAATYMRIRSDQRPGSAELADKIEAQYEGALSTLVDAWKGACAARELPKLEAIRNEASNIAPGLRFSQDALVQMQPCASPATTSNPAKPVTASKSLGCFAARRLFFSLFSRTFFSSCSRSSRNSNCA